MKVGSLVKIIEPQSLDKWQKGKLAVVIQKDKETMVNGGKMMYQYGLFIFEDNQPHFWFWENQLELVSDPFEKYRL